MLESIFGNATIEKVLLYLQNYNEGYASEIANTFSISLSVVQKQLKRLEDGGIIVSQSKGRTRLFLWNPRYPFRRELQSLLEKSFEFIPDAEIKKYYRKRQRPRRAGKLQLLTPTHSVMDRLAGYFHWNDKQNLDQALMIAKNHPIKIKEIESWAKNEGKYEKFETFKKRLSAVKK